MSDHPHTREAIERWRQGKINIFDALAELEDQRDEARALANERKDYWDSEYRAYEDMRSLFHAAQAECEEQARLLGKSAEREDILRTKAEQQKMEILKYTAVLEDIRNGHEGTCYACELVGEMNQQYRDTVRELIRLLEIEEESDSGTPFHPNRISSCRVMDGMKINQCLKTLKELAE
jgi:hypothetical protein